MNTTWRFNTLCVARLALAAGCWLSAESLFAQAQASEPVIIVNPAVSSSQEPGAKPPRPGTPRSLPSQKIENSYVQGPHYPSTGYPPFGPLADSQPLAPADDWAVQSGMIVNPYAYGPPSAERLGTVRLPAIGAPTSVSTTRSAILPLSPSQGTRASNDGQLPPNPQPLQNTPAGTSLAEISGGSQAIATDRPPTAPPMAMPSTDSWSAPPAAAPTSPPASEIRFQLPEGAEANPFASRGTGNAPPRELLLGPTNRWAIGNGDPGLSQPSLVQSSVTSGEEGNGQQPTQQTPATSTIVVHPLRQPSRLLPLGANQEGLSRDPFEPPLPVEAGLSGSMHGPATSRPGWLSPEAGSSSASTADQPVLQTSRETSPGAPERVQQGALWREPSVGPIVDPFEAEATAEPASTATDNAAATIPGNAPAADGSAASRESEADTESVDEAESSASQPPLPARRPAEVLLADLREAAQTASTHRQLTDLIDACRVALAERQTDGDAEADILASLSELAAWAHNRRGEVLAAAGDADAALADFNAAVQADEACWLAIHNRGITLAERGQHTEAERDFSRVIELQPGFALAHQNRAELLSSLGRTREAIQGYTAALQRSPDAMTYALRGFVHQRLGQHQEAIADFDESLRRWPENMDAYLGRGSARAESGAHAAAIADFETAIRINPANAEAHRSLAWLLATCADESVRHPARSLAAARRAAELAGTEDGFVLDTLAAAYASADRFADAVRYQRRAIEAAPELADLFGERLALYQQGRPYHGQQARLVRAATFTTPSRTAPGVGAATQ